ncbi:hypothetical protein [Leucobacter luti]|uniref:hypothetical protein n=1 Tax=Leucobacter luti TaxID=340320 RepID=UPI001C693ACC|nr:hypothetical protein [Leucobacter luti]QYM77124.1 hypothetical protein K1X41_07110 [Leucobacter luti]
MTPTHDNTNATPSTETQQTSERTLSYWLTMTDALVSREYARRFDAEGATRRDLRILSAISGTTEIPGRLREQLERGGKRVCALADRGWIERDETGWQLTDSGEEARTRLAGIVQETTDRIAGSVSREELATTTATLAAIAREFGWTEATRLRDVAQWATADTASTVGSAISFSTVATFGTAATSVIKSHMAAATIVASARAPKVRISATTLAKIRARPAEGLGATRGTKAFQGTGVARHAWRRSSAASRLGSPLRSPVRNHAKRRSGWGAAHVGSLLAPLRPARLARLSPAEVAAA